MLVFPPLARRLLLVFLVYSGAGAGAGNGVPIPFQPIGGDFFYTDAALHGEFPSWFLGTWLGSAYTVKISEGEGRHECLSKAVVCIR